jgi:hypothetical protein
MVREEVMGETPRAFIYAAFPFTALCWRRTRLEFVLLEPAEPTCGQHRPSLNLLTANCEVSVEKRVSVEMVPGSVVGGLAMLINIV